MVERAGNSKDRRRQTASFSMEVCRGPLGSYLECVVGQIAFENWLRRNCVENAIFVHA
jgi:hypothetical protein